MKNIFLSVLCLCANVCFAQTNFQGKVVFIATVAGKENKGDTLEIYFGDQKIKGIQKGTGKKKEDLLVRFADGAAYSINHQTRSYSIDSLAVKTLPDMIPVPDKNKLIAGQQASAYTVKPDSSIGATLMSAAMTFWYADSLYYSIPAQYAATEILALFTNGKNLGMGMSMSMQFGDEPVSVNARAVSIQPMSVPDSVFILPADYTIVTDRALEMAADSMAMITAETDTTAITATPKKPVKKTPRKPVPSKKAPIKKSSAIRKQ